VHAIVGWARLVGGELDVALLPLPVEVERLRVIEIGRDELVAVVPPDHAWVSLPFVTPRDFAEQPLLVYDRASQITDLTLGFLLDQGVFPRIAVEVDQLEALKDLAQRRLGVAVVPA
jgi:DNA-binding transcriptional LysR family regulator